ncbi:MAG TPA: hypothetical protein VJT09_02305 [Pyrinomonadaceae bacterium]|nr:hypothetical protein [Pyrinomonadaceae bacterium]
MAWTDFQVIPGEPAIQVTREDEEAVGTTPEFKITTFLMRRGIITFSLMEEKGEKGGQEDREVSAVTAREEVEAATARIALAIRAARETVALEAQAVVAGEAGMEEKAGRVAPEGTARTSPSAFRLTGWEILSILSGRDVVARKAGGARAVYRESQRRVVIRAEQLLRPSVLRPVRLMVGAELNSKIWAAVSAATGVMWAMTLRYAANSS